MLKSFKDFINENESGEPTRDEAKDLKRLLDLGLIGREEYLDGIFDWAKRSGRALEDLFEPGEVHFELELDDVSEEDAVDLAKGWISSWSGSQGEWVVQAKGLVGDEQLDLDLVLSTGAQVHLEWNAYDDRSNENWIVQDGRRSSPYAETMEEIEDDYMEHDDWDTYMQARLSAIVDSSREG